MTESRTPQEETLALIRQALADDQQAYAALYDQYAPGVYRLCYSLLFNRQDAEDVTQETFVYAFRNLSRYDEGKAGFKTWLYTIAVSRSRNVYRRRRPISLDIVAMMQLRLPAPHTETPEAQLIQRSAEEAISTALSHLSPRLREAVVLRYGHELTYREIAEVMGCPQKTAESRVRIAHEQLRNLLMAEGSEWLHELLTI
ncbi:MAG: RNA polymerase sigma factor [Phototrophicaceae bacterium]